MGDMEGSVPPSVDGASSIEGGSVNGKYLGRGGDVGHIGAQSPTNGAFSEGIEMASLPMGHAVDASDGTPVAADLDAAEAGERDAAQLGDSEDDLGLRSPRTERQLKRR